MAREKGGVVEAVGGDDLGEGMQCSEHPYRSNPGGICAFCLQEKLGMLVSSSHSSTPFLPFHPPPPSSSHSSPHSFRSDASAALGPISASCRRGKGSAGGTRSKIPFLGASGVRRKERTKVESSTTAASALGLKRSKSVAPRPAGGLGDAASSSVDSPRKKSFWSFLYVSSSAAAAPSSAAYSNGSAARRRSVSSSGRAREPDPAGRDPAGGAAEAEGPGETLQVSSSLGRKVARSRSVGCGSRSFSGDFLERLSNGFGDCTLRRVESHREAKLKTALHLEEEDGGGGGEEERRRIKCAGFFGGRLGMVSSSSYWLSAAAHPDGDARMTGRARSWAWAFASPMRVLRPSPSPAMSITAAASKSEDDNTVGTAARSSSPPPPAQPAQYVASQAN